MKKITLLLFSVVVVLVICPLSVYPQEFPKYEFTGGFSYLGMEERSWFGWNVSGVRNLNNYFGIEFDITGLYSWRSEDIFYMQLNTDLSRYFFLAGPKFTNRSGGNWAPYLHLLAGAARASGSIKLVQHDGQLYSSRSEKMYEFAMALGAGIDYKLKGPLAIRLFQADLINTHGDLGWVKGGRVTFGLILRQGMGGD